jgi:hypothetical protein
MSSRRSTFADSPVRSCPGLLLCTRKLLLE